MEMHTITLAFQILMEYCDYFAKMSQIELDSILSAGFCGISTRKMVLQHPHMIPHGFLLSGGIDWAGWPMGTGVSRTYSLVKGSH